jgi:predicted Zn-dependent protease
VAANPGAHKVRAYLVEFLLNRGMTDKAEQQVSEIEKKIPGTPLALRLRGDLEVAKTDYAKAVAAFEKVAAKSPSTGGLVRLARAYWLKGDRDKAVGRLSDWLKSHPDDIRVRSELADYQVVEKDFTAARKNYETLEKKGVKTASLYNNLAWTTFKQGRLDDAWGYAEKAKALAPTAAPVLDTYGQIALARGHTAAAIEAMNAAHDQSPKNPDYSINLARALAKRGDNAKAAALLDTVIKQFDETSGPGKTAREMKARLAQ